MTPCKSPPLATFGWLFCFWTSYPADMSTALASLGGSAQQTAFQRLPKKREKPRICNEGLSPSQPSINPKEHP